MSKPEVNSPRVLFVYTHKYYWHSSWFVFDMTCAPLHQNQAPKEKSDPVCEGLCISAGAKFVSAHTEPQDGRTVGIWSGGGVHRSFGTEVPNRKTSAGGIGRCKRLGSRQNQNARSAALNSGLPRVCQRNWLQSGYRGVSCRRAGVCGSPYGRTCHGIPDLWPQFHRLSGRDRSLHGSRGAAQGDLYWPAALPKRASGRPTGRLGGIHAQIIRSRQGKHITAAYHFLRNSKHTRLFK